MRHFINLLPLKKPSFMEQLFYFSLNYLRYIVVITQLVVIVVWFYRFQIDQRIIDLQEAIEQKEEIIQVVLPLLSQAKIIDKQTIEAEKIISEQNRFNQIANYLLSIFPASFTLAKLEIEKDTVKMVGLATNARELQSFYSLVKEEKKFAAINFESIKKINEGYSFILTLSKFNL